MKIKKFFLFLFLSLALPIFSQAKGTVKLSGYATNYAGYQIKLYKYADVISEEKITLNSFNINKDGSFETSFELNSITPCYAEFDAYQASLYLIPGKSYQLIFPPVKKLADSQKRNPFFKAEEISFATKTTDNQELNRQIQAFEIAYSKEESSLFNQIYHQKSMAAVDSLTKHLQQQFPKTDDAYFEDYKFYRTAFAEFALHQGRSENYITSHFIHHRPDLQIPPCAKLFKQLFTNHFLFEGNSIRGKDFKILVARADLSGIENYLISNNGWDKNLSRLVILQSINDAYFQGQFSQRSLLSLLDKIVASEWSIDNKEIAQRLKAKLTYLQIGSKAPVFSMTDFSGKKHQLNNLKDKYTYLNFTRVANPICRQHLNELKKSAAKLEKELRIINLIMPEEASKKDLILQQNWAGTFYIIDEKTADAYRISNFPQAYLIDEKGSLVLSPAPNPLDGFEQRFISLLKQIRLEKLRNQDK